MKPSERERWVVVAQFTAFDMGLSADMAVSKLQGSGIPARRFPSGAMTSWLIPRIPAAEWVYIVVPPEQAARAREILDHSEQESDE